MEHRIQYGTTSNTLRHLPPRAVASATYRIEDLISSPDSASRVLASGSATVDSVSTTLDASAGYTTGNARKIPLTATTSIAVGKSYWIEAASGTGEIVEVAGIVSGDYVTTTTPLLGEYASGATFTGLQITASFPDAEVTEERLTGRWPMRVVWSYTAGGQAYRVQETISIVRDTATESSGADALAQMRLLFPDLVTRMNADGREPARMIEGCRRQLVADLRARGAEPEQMLSGDIGRDLLMWETCNVLAMSGIAPGSREPVEWARDARKKCESLRALALSGVDGASVEMDRDHQSGRQGQRTRPILGGL